MAESPAPATPPACPGPDPAPRGPTRFRVPPGAVDTHAHVIGLPPAFPFVDARSYTPPAATPEAYLAMLDATGMAHGVLVQVSVHGTDNRLMLDTLRSTGGRLRGVGVVPPDLARQDTEAMRRAGVVGLRLNVLYGGGLGFDALDATEALCLDMGWHLQFLLDARTLPGALATRLSRLRVPFVVDHMGHFPANVAEPGFQTLLSLVRDGAWVKLSGAYRLAPEPWRATIPLARALHEAAPDRCIWGSDWPHVAHWDRMMNVGELLDLLADWVPDPAARDHVLVANAHRLYRFDSAAD